MRTDITPKPFEDGLIIKDGAEIAAAFTEWEKRYRQDPGKFLSEAAKLLQETPKSYGEACAPYFVKIIRELRAARTAIRRSG